MEFSQQSRKPNVAELFFVLCPSFHGATLFSLLLNNHSQLSSLGDTFPRRDLDEICSCGEPVSACQFWQSLLSGIQTERFSSSNHLLPDFPPFTSSRSVNRVAAIAIALGAHCLGSPFWRLQAKASSLYLDPYLQFRRRLLELHGSSTWIDGNKQTLRPFIMSTLPPGQFRCRIIHLVRDPRAFAFSSQNNKGEGLLKAAKHWRIQHSLIQFLYGGHKKKEKGDYIWLRYEDLSTQPQERMADIFQFLQVAPEQVVQEPLNLIKHHLLGNKMLRSFSGDVRLAESWRGEISPSVQEKILKIAGPFAHKMNYRL
jgi:hypothetical protein